jgi:nucleoid-associated protein YgaU
MGIVARLLNRKSTTPETDVAIPRPVARRTYLVARGDNLWKIAKREYGDANRWYEIFLANRRLIRPPELIHAGMTLRLP